MRFEQTCKAVKRAFDGTLSHRCLCVRIHCYIPLRFQTLHTCTVAHTTHTRRSCARTFKRRHTHTHTYTHIQTHTHTSTSRHHVMDLNLRTHTHTHTHTHTRTRTRTRIHPGQALDVDVVQTQRGVSYLCG